MRYEIPHAEVIKKAQLAVESNPLFSTRIRNVRDIPFDPQVAGWLIWKNIGRMGIRRLGIDFFVGIYMRDVVAKRLEGGIDGFDPVTGQKVLIFGKGEATKWFRQVTDIVDRMLWFMDGFMFTYLCSAVAGELRHAPEKVPDDLLNRWNIDKGTGSRHVTQVKFLKDMSASQTAAFLADAHRAFTRYAWPSSFGGKKWGAIAKTGLERAIGKLDTIMFIDRVFDLKHNGGPMFDKNTIVEQNGLTNFLDEKLYATGDSQWNGWVIRGSREIAKLVQLAAEVGIWKGAVPKETQIYAAETFAPVVLEGSPSLADAAGLTPFIISQKSGHLYKQAQTFLEQVKSVGYKQAKEAQAAENINLAAAQPAVQPYTDDDFTDDDDDDDDDEDDQDEEEENENSNEDDDEETDYSSNNNQGNAPYFTLKGVVVATGVDE